MTKDDWRQQIWHTIAIENHLALVDGLVESSSDLTNQPLMRPADENLDEYDDSSDEFDDSDEDEVERIDHLDELFEEDTVSEEEDDSQPIESPNHRKIPMAKSLAFVWEALSHR